LLILNLSVYSQSTTKLSSRGSGSLQSDIEKAIPASTNIPGTEYPLILPDNRVVFRVKAPNAQKIQVDLGKKYDMIKNNEGVWKITAEPKQMYQTVNNFHRELEKAGIQHIYYESPGTSHEWLTWRRSLHQFASMIFK
jgi:S-formylglutathione hydrolase FrmB